MPFAVTVRIQGIVGFKQNSDGTLGIGIPNTLDEVDLDGKVLKTHDPLVVFSWKSAPAGKSGCVPEHYLRLGRGIKSIRAVVGSPAAVQVPPMITAAPKMRTILKKNANEKCPWDTAQLLVPSFDLPKGELRGWPGPGYGTMKDVDGQPVTDLALGAEWTMGVARNSSFTLAIEGESQKIEVTLRDPGPGKTATVWLINHPVAHGAPSPGAPEEDFLWYYWMLKDRPSKRPLPTAPTIDVPHIGFCPRVASTGGQLCRPCEFCPD